MTFGRWQELTAHLDDHERCKLFLGELPEEARRDCYDRIKYRLEDERRDEAFWAGYVDYAAKQQVRRLPAPRRRHLGATRVSTDDPLASIPPPLYFEALAGIPVPDHGGTVCCPLHEERTPSCHVYAEPDRGWFCFGACHKGGTIYDLGAELFHIEPRGKDFEHLRRRIAESVLNAPCAVASNV
jgi:hypothetical protein